LVLITTLETLYLHNLDTQIGTWLSSLATVE